MDLSDHTPISLNLTGPEKKNTVWRLNTGILHQSRQQIRKDIKDYLDENDNGEVSPPILWDACKAVLRGKSFGYCSNFKKSREEKKSIDYKQN